MPVHFDCSCGHSLSAAASQAGQALRCPRCDREVFVPTLAQSAVGLPQPPFRAARGPEAAPPARPNKVFLGVMCGLLVLILVGIGAFVWWMARDKGPPGSKYLRPAARAQTQNNLKWVMLALRSYHDAHNQFPPPVIREPGQPPRSWRVEILP